MSEGTWYRTGLVSLTNGSDLVAGAGTEFIANVLPGAIFFAPEGLYEVERAVSDTQLKLVEPYAGPTVAGVEFAIAPTQGAVVQATKQLQAFLSELGPLKQAWETGELEPRGLATKGVKNSVEDLPAIGNTPGDAWLVDGVLYMWTGSAWSNQGSTVTTPELEVLRDQAIAAKDASEGIAATFGDVAGAVGAATAKAGEAGVSAAAAAAREAGALLAKTAAESARDAAVIGAGVFADEPTGRAAVANGVAFKVQGAGNVAAYEYRRVSAAASTLIATYPSSARVEGLKSVTDTFYAAAIFSLVGFIYKDTGGFLATSIWRATDFLPVLGGVAYTVDSSTTGNGAHAWYDKNKVLISVFGVNQAAPVTVTSPAGARYMRASAYNGYAASITSTEHDYSIEKVARIVAQHPQDVLGSSVKLDAESLPAVISRLEAVQTDIYKAINQLANQLDLVSDATAPYFVNTWAFTRSGRTSAAGVLEAAVVSRLSDTTLQIQSGYGVYFVEGGALVVEDSVTGRINSFPISAVNGDVLTIVGVLPAAPTRCQTMFDSDLGQHLSRLAYLGLADFVTSRTQRLSYKKEPLFEFHAPICSALVYNNPNIFNLAGTLKLFDVVPLGTAVGGGFVAGTTNTSRTCSMGLNVNAGDAPASQYTSRSYVVTDSVQGNGIEIAVPVSRRDGFIEIPVSAEIFNYISSVDGQTYRATGRIRVQVVGGDGTVFHDQAYAAGVMNYLNVEFTGQQSLRMRISLADAAVTRLKLFGIYAYPKAPATPTETLFRSGDVIGFLGDSWTQYPVPIAGEVRPLRPDGSTGDGMQFLSERIRTRLAAEGISVTTLNMGRGGQTSAWGKYWIDKMIALTPKLTKCVLCFGINDNNSAGAFASDSDSAYDFSPTNQWLNLVKSAGGRKGSVSNDLWFANLQFMCERLIAAGIKPVVLMPMHTASTSQAQSIRDNFLNKMACGFRNTNETGGGS